MSLSDNNILILLAGGNSIRFKTNKLKADIKGIPLFIFSLTNFVKSKIFSKYVCVVKAEDFEFYKALIAKYFPEINDKFFLANSGQTRAESARNGLEFISNNNIRCSTCFITDCARCNTSINLISRLSKTLKTFDNAIPCIRRGETFKIIENGKVLNQIKNNNLFEIQTPQVYNFNKIYFAYKNFFNANAVDDSQIYFECYRNENYNIVQGELTNIKITTPDDISLIVGN